MSPLPWPEGNGNPRKSLQRSALPDTALDLAAMPDAPVIGGRQTAYDPEPVREVRGRHAADKALDATPVPDVPVIGVRETAYGLAPVPEVPGPDLADTAVDQAPVRGGAARDLADTAFDLAPVWAVPEGDVGRHDLARLRPAHGSGGAHAGHGAGRTRQTDGTRSAPAQRPAVPERPAVPGRWPAVAERRPGASQWPSAQERQFSALRQLPDPRQLANPRRLPDPRRPAGSTPAWRTAVGVTMAGVMLATVIPLCLLQVPYAPVPPLSGTGAAAAQAAAAAGPAGVLRAASLALPFAVAVAPLAALAMRRLRAIPVLLAGLLITVAADGLTWLYADGTGQSGALAATNGALHGVAAGLAIPATMAIVTEHAGLPRRLLAAWWAAVTVAALAVLPGLSQGQTADGRQAALGPVPWLTIAALAAGLLYPVLAGGSWQVRRRGEGAANRAARPVAEHRLAERARLALLAPAAAALGVIAVAATYQPAATIVAAAMCGAAELLAMTAVAVRRAAGDGFGIVCTLAGLFLAPASAALVGLRAMASAGAPAGTVAPGLPLAVAAAIGAIVGASTSLITARAKASRRAGAPLWISRTSTPPQTGRLPVHGLLLAAAALAAASLAGPFARPALLGLLVAAVTGGLAAALARPAAQATTAGAMAGVVVLVGGALAGYLAAGAITVHLAGVALAGRMVTAVGQPNKIGFSTAGAGAGSATWPAAVPGALVSAASWWELAVAAVAVLVAIVRCVRRARADAPIRWQPRHHHAKAPRGSWPRRARTLTTTAAVRPARGHRGGGGGGVRPAHR